MEMLAAILGALVAVFIGAWVNSVFILKIKDKIKSIDKFYPYLWQLDLVFKDFVFNQVQEFRTPEGTEKELLRRKSATIKHELEVNISNLYLYDGILDKKFNNDLVKYTDKLAYIFNIRGEFWKYYQDNGMPNDKFSQSTVDEYVELTKFFRQVLAYRKDLTSFEYMLNELYSSMKQSICKHCNCSKNGNNINP